MVTILICVIIALLIVFTLVFVWIEKTINEKDEEIKKLKDREMRIEISNRNILNSLKKSNR
jgi:ATP/ADP translocase